MPFPRNEPCPCGSGDEHNRCCFTKGFHFYLDDEIGDVYQAAPLNSEGTAMTGRQKVVTAFGRNPGADDDLHFDLDEDKFARTPPTRCVLRVSSRVR